MRGGSGLHKRAGWYQLARKMEYRLCARGGGASLGKEGGVAGGTPAGWGAEDAGSAAEGAGRIRFGPPQERRATARKWCQEAHGAKAGPEAVDPEQSVETGLKCEDRR